MTEPAPQPAHHEPLRLVDRSTGEVIECPNCADLEALVQDLRDQLAGADKDIAAWRTRYANLKRDRNAEARSNEAWPRVKEIYDYWRQECGHPRSRFTGEDFWIIEPYFRLYGPELCRRAIEGAAFDPYRTKRRNGSWKRHDGIPLIFRSREKFEEFCNRSPRRDKLNGCEEGT